jgi:ABC-type branched-subunit amino acid transport system substrate-binding protein
LHTFASGIPARLRRVTLFVAVFAATLSTGVALSSARATRASAAAASPVKVLIYGDITVSAGVESYSQFYPQAEAAIDSANASGGINGHHIDVVLCDTKEQPSVAIACVKSAIKKGVVAAISSESILEPQVVGPLEAAHIPLIGDILNSPQGSDYKAAYCVNSGAAGDFEGAAVVGKKLGIKTMGFIAPGGTPQTSSFDTAFTAALKEYGINVNISNPAVTETNWTAAAESAGAGAQGIFLVSPGPAVAFAQQIKTALPKINLIVVSSVSTFGRFPDSLNGTNAIGWNEPPTATKVPGIQRYLASIKKYDPKANKTDIGVLVWAGADLFARAARTISGPVTAKSLIAAMNKLKNFPMYGVTPNYTTSHRGALAGDFCASNTTVVPMKFKNGLLYADSTGFVSVKTS